MILANPIYDVTFKALMSDLDVAKGIISRVLGRQVLKLNFSSQEFPIKDVRYEGETITLMRMDFAALIRDENGKELNVLIEIQKAKIPEDIGRFRHYLGRQYMTPTETEVEPPSKHEDADIEGRYLPIFTIYLLNFKIDAPVPLIRVKRQLINAGHEAPLEEGLYDEFLESLTHDAFVVQFPRLPSKPNNDLERTFALFNQKLIKAGDKHRIYLEDGTELGDDVLVQKMMHVLEKVAADRETEDRMNREDVLVEDQQRALRKIERKLRMAEQEKEQAQQEKEQAQQEKEQAQLQLQHALKSLITKGMPEVEARTMLGIQSKP